MSTRAPREGNTMNNQKPPTCSLCEQPIIEGEAWEYEKGAYPIHIPESEKRRVHSRCVSALLREALAAFARAREDKQDKITFEI